MTVNDRIGLTQSAWSLFFNEQDRMSRCISESKRTARSTLMMLSRILHQKEAASVVFSVQYGLDYATSHLASKFAIFWP
jgi:hypothetical protein